MKNKIVSVILIIMIVAAGVYVSDYLKSHRRKPHRWKRRAMPVYVETKKAVRVNIRYRIEGFGNVEAMRDVTLVPEVSGKVIWVNSKFYPGGYFKKGEVILKIDPTDYRLDLIKKKAALESLREDLKIEQGKRRAAFKEYMAAKGVIRGGFDNSSLYLILREPYLKKLQNSIKRAEADLKLAEIRLSKTVVKAPFDCYVVARYVNLGSYLSAASRIAEVVYSNAYYIKAFIPVEELKQLGNYLHDPVRVYFSKNDVYSAHIISILPDVDKKGLLAGLLLVVKGLDDPLSGLKLNNYAKVVIEGKKLEDVTRIPVRALRENSRVWLYVNGRLKIKTISVVFRDKHFAYTYDVKPGSDVIVSEIATPVENMRLYKGTDDKDHKVFYR